MYFKIIFPVRQLNLKERMNPSCIKEESGCPA
jgi:hypothetical protein